jgi:FixJ family two-component response regulator
MQISTLTPPPCIGFPAKSGDKSGTPPYPKLLPGPPKLSAKPAVPYHFIAQFKNVDGEAAPMNEKILIVEDDAAVRASISRHLEDLQYVPFEAVDAPAAIESFDKEHHDLILLDLRLPGMDGLELLRRIRHKSADVPVVIVSGKGDIHDAVSALRLGAWDYVFKPITDMGALEHAVKKALERSQLLRQNEAYRLRLEEMVALRTAELESANSALRKKQIALEEVLSTYRSDSDRRITRTIERIEQYCDPVLAKLRHALPASQKKLADQITTAIAEATSEPLGRLAEALSILSPTELRVSNLIRQGKASKEIAASAGISVDTVETHRRNIRRKLKITNESINLITYLNQLASPGAIPSADSKQ